jgi:hypothetical protein
MIHGAQEPAELVVQFGDIFTLHFPFDHLRTGIHYVKAHME